MSESNATEIVIVDPDDIEFVYSTARQYSIGVEELRAARIEPAFTMTLVLMGTSFAVGAVVYLVEQRKGGQVIDLRPSAPNVLYRSKEVSYGLVIIFTVDGKVSIEVKEPRGMFGHVLDSLSDLVGNQSESSMADIVRSVDKLVGQLVITTVTETPADDHPARQKSASVEDASPRHSPQAEDLGLG
jgi:hypothetical protein